MSLLPSIAEKLSRARADLRMGGAVVLRDGPAGLVFLAAETLTPARLTDLTDLTDPRAMGGGNLHLVLTARRAGTLRARAYDGDIARIRAPADVDATWLRALADPADDLDLPMKGPLISERDGDAGLHRTAIRLAKDAQVLPAVLTLRIGDPAGFANDRDLTLIDADRAATRLAGAAAMTPVVHARLPMRAARAGRLHIFRPGDGGVEHYAIEIGHPARAKPVLARLHSACFTGDVLGSLKCDCGPQLNTALARMGREGAGVLLYLNQEGRGIGLANKMRAYSLQDLGFDTVEANHRLGFEDDERDFRIGAGILEKLGFSAVRLMTNNPAKIDRMREMGIEVAERVPLKVGLTAENRAYLDTKARKSGHLF